MPIGPLRPRPRVVGRGVFVRRLPSRLSKRALLSDKIGARETRARVVSANRIIAGRPKETFAAFFVSLRRMC